MLKIKLARFGKRNQPHYRFVVTEARSKRDGKYNANLGHYAPTQNPKLLEIDVKAYDEWVKRGAQPTETVAALYKKFKSGNPFPPKKKKPSKKQLAKANQPKEETESKKAPAAEKTADKSSDKEEQPTEKTAADKSDDQAQEKPAKDETKEEAPEKKSEDKEDKKE